MNTYRILTHETFSIFSSHSDMDREDRSLSNNNSGSSSNSSLSTR